MFWKKHPWVRKILLGNANSPDKVNILFSSRNVRSLACLKKASFWFLKIIWDMQRDQKIFTFLGGFKIFKALWKICAAFLISIYHSSATAPRMRRGKRLSPPPRRFSSAWRCAWPQQRDLCQAICWCGLPWGKKREKGRIIGIYDPIGLCVGLCPVSRWEWRQLLVWIVNRKQTIQNPKA